MDMVRNRVGVQLEVGMWAPNRNRIVTVWRVGKSTKDYEGGITKWVSGVQRNP